jgi:hypothetical protein
MKIKLRNYQNKLQNTVRLFSLLVLLSLLATQADAQRCGVNGITFTQQAGFGNNSQIIIGGFGQNDGAINFNCYSDSSVYGRSRIFNRPVGIFPPAGSTVPTWSSRIFQDLPNGILRIQTSPVNFSCYDSVPWNRGITMHTSGIVGIGTNPISGYTLAVNGGIACKNDMMITLTGITWPDYVFARNYRLKPLLTLEQEIDSLGHLPGMPSAEQIENEGLSVTTVTTTVVKKVEELTLYTIDQQKQLDELKKQNKQLQKQTELLQRQNEELKVLIERLLKEKE